LESVIKNESSSHSLSGLLELLSGLRAVAASASALTKVAEGDCSSSSVGTAVKPSDSAMTFALRSFFTRPSHQQKALLEELNRPQAPTTIRSFTYLKTALHPAPLSCSSSFIHSQEVKKN